MDHPILYVSRAGASERTMSCRIEGESVRLFVHPFICLYIHTERLAGASLEVKGGEMDRRTDSPESAAQKEARLKRNNEITYQAI